MNSTDDQPPPTAKTKTKNFNKTRRQRKPTAHEDVVDGFAFLAFKNYDELQRAIKLGEDSSSKICVQVVHQDKGKQRNASTNTSPLTTTSQNKPKSPSKKKSKKLMDQENGDGERTERCLPESGTSPAPFATLNNSSVVEESVVPTPAKHPKKARQNKEPRLSNHFRDRDGQSDELKIGNASGESHVDLNLNLNLISKKQNKISSGTDGCSDLFGGPPRKDSSSRLSDNLSTKEVKVGEARPFSKSAPLPPQPELAPPPPTSPGGSPPLVKDCAGSGNCSTTKTTSGATATTTSTATATDFRPVSTTASNSNSNGIGTPSTTNGPSNGTLVGELNGHEAPPLASPSPKVSSFFTPYATNTITRVSLGSGSRANSYDASPTESSKPVISNQSSNSNSKGTDSTCGSSKEHKSQSSSTGKVTPTGSKSLVFGSIARLLDSPTTTSSSSSNRSSPSVSVVSANHPSPVQQQGQGGGSGNGNGSGSGGTARSHSPRGHSPSRERDSYSSNVSSLSRTSVTPVSGSSLTSHLPANLSPQLSYSKAVNWLSSVPVPRPTPPPPPVSSHHCLGPSFGVTSPMFAPPILPLQNSPQAPPFGPNDQMLHGMYSVGSSQNQNLIWSSPSELVRRDLESRFLSTANSREPPPSHSLLPPPPNPNSLFPPQLYKEMPKVGMESPYYRGASLGLPYPGFNGMLPPPPSIGTPFAPPSQLPTFTPKKTGRWNAMHVRIAWEIYQHQQKSNSNSSPNANPIGPSSDLGGKGPLSLSSSLPPNSNPMASLVSNASIASIASMSSMSSMSMASNALYKSSQSQAGMPPDLFRPPGHVFPPPPPRPHELSPFPSPLLSPHAPRPPGFDSSPPHPLFLPSAPPHLGPPLARYPGFGGLGSPFVGGLGSNLGSSLLGRELQSLPPPQSIQDHRHASKTWSMLSDICGSTQDQVAGEFRLGRSAVSSSSSVGVWPPPEVKRPTSPFRDRSPVRLNGDTDSSRSSRSTSSDKKEDKSRTNTPFSDISKGPPSLPQNSRTYPGNSPLSSITSISSIPGYDTGGGYGRLSSAESFRLSLLQLGERERELSRFPPQRFGPSSMSSQPPLPGKIPPPEDSNERKEER